MSCETFSSSVMPAEQIVDALFERRDGVLVERLLRE